MANININSHLKDITLDEQGRVVITNDVIAQQLEKVGEMIKAGHFATEGDDTNNGACIPIKINVGCPKGDVIKIREEVIFNRL
ncbi:MULTISPECIES: hypothetical protein [Paenibacillus]|uniref:Uncharacterized protein n=1 Tax=Paenibacillus violae TaxID=3077234 RepID=A0ABU3R9E4_9BACL|nr:MULTISPECIES: hypothetical protein [Paenibacillus]MDU0200886.1 hypothetical protein [Paenibacillus sp. PFR10]MEC0264744.1 hypothetical protein [Paenibacillus anseongense]